jgi:hypothetical protein
LIFRTGGNFFNYNNEYRYFVPETDNVYKITSNQISPYLALNLPIPNQNNPKTRPVIYSYSENESFVFFKTEINNIPHDILFKKKTKEITPISIFNLEERFIGLPINILCISGNCLIATVSKNSMEYIQSLIFSGKMNNGDVKEFIENNGAFNLLVCYEFK